MSSVKKVLETTPTTAAGDGTEKKELKKILTDLMENVQFVWTNWMEVRISQRRIANIHFV